MTKLDKLINVFCPNGVNFVHLDDCIEKIENFKWKIGSDFEYKYIDLTSVDRETHQISDTKIIKAGNAPSRAQQIVQIGDVLVGTTRPMLKRYCLIDTKYDNQICSTGFCVLRANTRKTLPKWIYYQVASTEFFIHVEKLQKGASYPAISDAEVKRFQIPLPPLPVQQEIVRILDNFTELTAELTAELTVELTARKKQYEYYRSSLMLFGDDVPMSPLGELATNLDAKRKPVTKGDREAGKYPYYGASGIIDFVSDYIFDGDYLLISEDGANLTARVTPIAFSASGKIWVNNHAHVLQFDTYVERKFVEYYLNMIDLSRYISTAAQPKLTQNSLNKILVPNPIFEEKERIVAVLDRFEILTNDMISGLPAEIEARRKQYEYYRDKLLTFKEAK